MSVLDTFVILFTADTDDVERGLRQSRMLADDLIDSLRDADRAADAIASSVRDIADAAGWAKTAILSVVGALAGGEIFASLTERATEIGLIAQNAEALGLAVEDVDAFGRAMGALGLDAQGARDSLTDMAEAIGDALQDTEGSIAQAFTALKVNLKDANNQPVDAIEGLLRLADAAQSLSKEEAIFRIKEIGITDNRTVEAVLKGRKELEALLATQKAQGVLTKELAERAIQFNSAMTRLKASVSAVGMGVASDLLPYLTPLFDALAGGVDWLMQHQDVVIGFFAGVASIVTTVYIPAMVRAAAATLAATWPFIAIGVAIAAAGAAIALAYDDIQNFLAGNDSLIGTLLERYPAVGQALTALAESARNVFGVVADLAGSVWSLLSEFVGLLADVGQRIWALIGEDVLSAFRSLGDGVASIFGGMIEVVQRAWSIIGNILGSLSSGVRGAAGIIRGVRSWLGIGEADPQVAAGAEALRAGQSQIADASSSPLNNRTSAGISNTAKSVSQTASVTVGELTVQTQATDARGMADGARGALSDQLANLGAEFSSGVDR